MALETMLMALWIEFVASLPGLVAALITLIIGLIIGKVLGRVIKEVLVKLKVDEYVLENKQSALKLSDMFSVIARWWVYLVFISQAAVFLGVATITTFVESVISFIPGLIEAAMIIIVGYVLAEYIKDKVVNKKTFYGSIAGKAIFFLLLYVSIALALPFVGIDTLLINWILLIIIGSVGLGIAIATGLGLKDVVAEEAKKYIRKKR